MERENGYILLPQPIEEEAKKMLEDEGLEVVLARIPARYSCSTYERSQSNSFADRYSYYGRTIGRS